MANDDTATAILLERPTERALAGLGADTLARLLADLTRSDTGLSEALQARLAQYCGKPPRASGRQAQAGEPYMVGASPAMTRVFEAIRRFAVTDAPVLITGESGTGKELAAQAVHERSSRADGPFVAINCAGLPPTLISSELFGHEKGAFTGAHQRKIGRIEAAEGGTVFLDEIGDLPLELQPHLLRFLQESTIDRIGGHRPIRVNVRVVAATNKDLMAEMQAGRFREDLFYRLNVLTLELPALRQRGDDIDLISAFFVRQFAGEIGAPVRGFSPEAMAAIRRHPWPGNVRELISRVRRAVVMTDGEWVSAEDLGLTAPGGADPSAAPDPRTPRADTLSGGPDFGDRVPTLEEARNSIEEALLRKALQVHGGNVTSASDALGVSRVTFYRLMEKHGVRTGSPDPS